MDHYLPEFIRNTCISYVQVFNIQSKRSGPLFEGRFKSVLVNKETYILQLCRYIHLNPVHAGLVKNPEEWQFSNYLEWVGIRNGSLVDNKFIKNHFESIKHYRLFITEDITEKRLADNLNRYKID